MPASNADATMTCQDLPKLREAHRRVRRPRRNRGTDGQIVVIWSANARYDLEGPFDPLHRYRPCSHLIFCW